MEGRFCEIDKILSCVRLAKHPQRAIGSSEFLAYCQRAQRLFEEDKVEEAFVIVTALEKAADTLEDPETATMLLCDFAPVFLLIKDEFEVLCSMLEHCADADDWKLAKCKDGITTHYRHNDSEGLVTVR
jgi:hypothetical protein